MFTKAIEISDRLHKLPSDIDRVTRHEADPPHSRDIVEAVEKIVEKTTPLRLIFAITIYILTEQGNLLISLFDKLSALQDNIIGRTGDFGSARIGDNAIGAEFVTPTDDRYVSFMFILPFRDRIIQFLGKFLIGPDSLCSCKQNFIEYAREVMDIIGAQNKVNMGEFLKEALFWRWPCNR